MKEYPHAITKKCSQCGRIFTCKGTGWTKLGYAKQRCPYEKSDCNCERCHHGKSRGEGCEEIELKERVEFT